MSCGDALLKFTKPSNILTHRGISHLDIFSEKVVGHSSGNKTSPCLYMVSQNKDKKPLNPGL